MAVACMMAWEMPLTKVLLATPDRATCPEKPCTSDVSHALNASSTVSRSQLTVGGGLYLQVPHPFATNRDLILSEQCCCSCRRCQFTNQASPNRSTYALLSASQVYLCLFCEPLCKSSLEEMSGRK